MTPIFLFLVAIFFAIPPVNALGWEIKLTGDKDYDTSHGDIFYDKQQGILVFIKVSVNPSTRACRRDGIHGIAQDHMSVLGADRNRIWIDIMRQQV